MARLEAELARQIRRHNYLAAVASERAAETGAVRDQLAAMQGDRDRLQLQIDSLHRSTSWRITQPLRNVMQWLRKGA